MATQGTKHCIVCGKKPKIFTGHVLDGREKVIAGWCQKHYDAARNMGLYGRWRKYMGKQDY